jgi:imidazolonepropionase-like amidohydrolase
VSVLVDAGRVTWIRPSTDEGDLPPDVHVIDAGGSTIVPGMVDAHSHVTLPGGSHWIDRGADPPEELLEVAEHNGDLLGRAGVRWARDVGSPLAVDPRDGNRRASPFACGNGGNQIRTDRESGSPERGSATVA